MLAALSTEECWSEAVLHRGVSHTLMEAWEHTSCEATLGRSHSNVCVCCLFFSKLPVQCCAVGMVNTSKVAACVTVAGRALNVMFPPTSASTSPAAAMGPALWELASATQATRARTVKKVK